MEDGFERYRRHYPDGTKSHNTWGHRIETLAKAVPGRIAFIQGENSVTWSKFDRKVNRLARALISLGVEREDRVAIMGFNSIAWMEAYFAASKIGAVPANVNPRFIAPEIKYIIENADAKILFTDPDYLELSKSLLADLPLLKHVIVMGEASGEKTIDSLIEGQPDSPPALARPVTNEDFSCLFFTGGTTGYPKGTVWDYENRVRGLDAIMVTALKPLVQRLPDLPSEAFPALLSTLPLPITEGMIKSRPVRRLLNFMVESEAADRLVMRVLGTWLNYRFSAGNMRLIVLAPLFHGTAYETMFSMIGASGGTSIFMKKPHPFNPSEFWRAVETHKANLAVIVGDAFAIPMVEDLEKNSYNLSSLAAIISSGVRFSPLVKKRFLHKLPGLVVLDELGSTETSAAFAQVSSSIDTEIDRLRVKIVKTGINQNRVLNPVTGEDVKPGEKGELAFGGYNSLGYWKDPERTARHFRDLGGKRWFFVGDEGTVDEEGFFNFIGRGSSIINTGGEKVYAEEVEEILMSHPQVRDAAVTGVPDERWGEAVTALIETDKDADMGSEEVIEFCRERMAGYKKPKHVFLVEQIPRTATGKLARKDLKEWAEKLTSDGNK